MIDPGKYPATQRLTAALTSVWPEHSRFLEKSFEARDELLMGSTEAHAAVILKLIGGNEALFKVCGDYRFLCDAVMEEELHFRRHGAYRLSRFQDALEQVYSNAAFMGRYMNFLLLSHVLWENHARAMDHYERAFLPLLPDGARHLEIGPGHGLLVHLAASRSSVAEVTGWDVSETSLQHTASCVEAMGSSEKVTLALRDIFDASPGHDGDNFDSVVLSEILEHLEDPIGALVAVSKRLKPGGLLWVNVPVNSPAPDHIFLLRTPEEAVELVSSAGFTPLDTGFFPMSGQSLDRARAHQLSISVVVTARLD